jgi:hypothetical protein
MLACHSSLMPWRTRLLGTVHCLTRCSKCCRSRSAIVSCLGGDRLEIARFEGGDGSEGAWFEALPWRSSIDLPMDLLREFYCRSFRNRLNTGSLTTSWRSIVVRLSSMGLSACPEPPRREATLLAASSLAVRFLW